MEITENESMFLQGLAITSLPAELSNNSFLESEYYKKLNFSNDTFKEILNLSGIGNPATMQMFLYILIVLPKEILKDFDNTFENKCKVEVNNLCIDLVEDTTNTTYSGENDISSIDYYHHIRNAVSHATCYYKQINGISYVTFKDTHIKDISQYCEITIQTSKVGSIFEKLQLLMMQYINEKIKERSKKKLYRK